MHSLHATRLSLERFACSNAKRTVSSTLVASRAPKTSAAMAAAPGLKEAYEARWEKMWSAGLQPGQKFDITQSAPSLMELLRSGELDVKGQRVLVPGCGRGYDLPTFAQAGAAQVVGLELAPTAVAAAQAYLQGLGLPADVAAKLQVMQADFFTYPEAPGTAGSFQVGYDYTFFCAMHPALRADWAATWAKLLAPGATLITLQFPVSADMDPAVGPPFAVTPQLYDDVMLGPAEVFEKVAQREVPPALSHPSREAQEHLAIWRRK